jgi:hypothetical protein
MYCQLALRRTYCAASSALTSFATVVETKFVFKTPGHST